VDLITRIAISPDSACTLKEVRRRLHPPESILELVQPSWTMAQQGRTISASQARTLLSCRGKIYGDAVPRRITIEGLKQIDKLIFDVPEPGVHVLSGANGTGKSSLLACLLRLGLPNAFQASFRTSKISTALDNFTNAKITYEVNNSSVRYQHSGVRWEPTPKRESKLVASFGFSSVIFAAANSERIEPRAEDFIPQRVRDASQTLKHAAKLILADAKFDNLKLINVRRGVGAEAFLLPDAQSTTTRRRAYFSEKNFSLGELCVLKLLRQLDTCPDGSLVLIDELELALHPRAQIRLFRHLEEVSRVKTLTTIFSTHSVSLIKSVDRSKLYFVDRIGGRTELIQGCYPTYALGQLALDEERTPDVALFVEDEQAQFIVQSLIRQLLQSDFQGLAKPAVVVVPVGPITSVLAFLPRASSLLPDSVRKHAILDHDAYGEYLAPLEAAGNHIELAKFQRVRNQIGFLPWTPEVGICQDLAANVEQSERALRAYFADNRISIAEVRFQTLTGLTGGPQRRAAKTLVADIVARISEVVQRTPDRVRQDLSDFFATACMAGPQAAALRALLLPLLR
jgi:ABC-type lipoprotein export system ATPase subunit